ncbi:hypothetical protein [Flindersiella endophytica]
MRTSPPIARVPILLVIAFAAVITGWFNLSEALPTPLAVLAGAAWGAVIGWLGLWIQARRPMLGAWLEDGFVYLGAIGFAFAGCGGLMAILLLTGTLDSASVTGETLEQTFLPSIPYYIVVNSILEVLIIPAVIVLGWRPGPRRVLILATAATYFAMRVWTYLAFVPARLGWADAEHSTQVLTAAQRHQAADDLMLDDPRWIPLLVMFAVFLVAAHWSRVRSLHGAAKAPA